MVQILVNIISYGAFLVLLLPVTVSDLLFTVMAFILGCGIIVFKKGFNLSIWKNKQAFLIPASLFVVLYLSYDFYTRWMYSSVVQVIAGLFYLKTEIFLLLISSIMAVLSIFWVYAMLQIIFKKLLCFIQRHTFAANLLFSLFFAASTVLLAQYMIDVPLLSMGYVKFLVGVLIVWMMILLFYILFGNIISSIFFGSGIFMIISTINVYVYQFRERLFEPVDIFSARTAMNVAQNYNLFPIPDTLLKSWAAFAVILIVLFLLLYKVKADFSVKKRLIILAACALGFSAVSLYISDLKTYHWKNGGAVFNGYILDFTAKFKEISASNPQNYSEKMISDLADQYMVRENIPDSASAEYPHIIVIMDEAFSDLRVAGDFTTNIEVTPFISSLKEEAISGYTLVSVHGGNTANSEYEFLTGHSLAWLSPNAVPYQQYIQSPTYSMVSYLKSSYDYRCVAMHPYDSSGWNRPAAYRHLGFDTCYFSEDFPHEKYSRYYISDQEMFEFLIKTFEEHKDGPLFLFGVTMQNHGDYMYTGDRFTQTVFLNDYGSTFADVEQYLSSIHETDKAVEYLITYFENVEEDVLILFFGDHQPQINELFYDTISGKPAETLDEQQKRYKVPFFIWTNYDMEEKYVDCTSLNYLSSYVYDAARIPLPPYNRFLQEMEQIIPAINAHGFYSPDQGCYLPFGEANETEQEWLRRYEALQYNSLFDRKHRSEVFFPAPQ